MSLVDVNIPKVGMSTIEVDVTAILVEVGASVDAGQPLIEISTDKVDITVESPARGRIHAILIEVDDIRPVGFVAMQIATEDES